MSMQGERFELDLDPEEAYERYAGRQGNSQSAGVSSAAAQADTSALGLNFVKDVLERAPSSIAPPQAPILKQNATGFPAHKKRVSRFKQVRGGNTLRDGADTAAETYPPGSSAGPGTYLSKIAKTSAAERQEIDRQTTQMIRDMSEEELRDAQKELLGDPSFAAISRLLKRANIDTKDTGLPPYDAKGSPTSSASTTRVEDGMTERPKSSKKTVSFAQDVGDTGSKHSVQLPEKVSGVPIYSPQDIQPVSTSSATYRTPLYRSKYSEQTQKSILAQEAAKPPPEDREAGGLEAAVRSPAGAEKLPTLDPNSDTFLTDLHSTYFPNLPADPRSLSWMAPIETGDSARVAPPTNGPGAQSDPASHIAPANLRFDFRGSIVSASRSASIPVTKGLHHHGRDPGAAGYTITELSMYERSTVAGQRCFAYQLLGRILYRLGIGDFKVNKTRSKSNDEVNSNLAASDRTAEIPNENSDEAKPAEESPDEREKGLWYEIRSNHIIEQMLTEAGREVGTGSESARIWALEAVWLWRKGGGKGFEDEDGGEGDVMGDAAAQILEEGLNPQF